MATGGAGTELDGFGEVGDGAIEIALQVTLASTFVVVLGGAKALPVSSQCETGSEHNYQNRAMVKHV